MLPPPVTDQETVEVMVPVPWTLAVHCEVDPAAIVEGEQLDVTEEMAGEVTGEGAAPGEPPQEITNEKTRQASNEQRSRVFKAVLQMVLRHAWGCGSCPAGQGKKVINLRSSGAGKRF